MTKWVIVGVVMAVFIGWAIITEVLQDEWYKGYLDGIAYAEELYRKERNNGENDKSV